MNTKSINQNISIYVVRHLLFVGTDGNLHEWKAESIRVVEYGQINLNQEGCEIGIETKL